MLPEAKHRAYARHIYANWSKKQGGEELQMQFWKTAWSTFEEEFIDNMKKLNEISSNAIRALMAYPPHTWCHAYFSSQCKCWEIDNNFT